MTEPRQDIQGWFDFREFYDAVVEHLKHKVWHLKNGVFEDPQDDVKRLVLVEVGVWKGASIIYLAQKMLEVFKPEQFVIYAVDNFSMADSGPDNKTENREKEKIHQHGGDLYTIFQRNVEDAELEDVIKVVCQRHFSIPCSSLEAAEQFEDQQCDFVFLDADHSTAAVEADFLAWLPKTRILAGHDGNQISVRQGLRNACGKLQGQKDVLVYDLCHVGNAGCWTTSKDIAEKIEGEHPRLDVFIGVPCGTNHSTHMSVTQALLNAQAGSRHRTHIEMLGTSFLPHTFNRLFCNALNSRSLLGVTHFVMLHDDIGPILDNWLDSLLEIMETYELDVLSAIVPIKDPMGLTSTALDTDPWQPRRLTMSEVEHLPETFMGPIEGHNVLFNTGLMAIKVNNRWCEDICFGFDNMTVAFPTDGGGHQYHAFAEPEDWRFARWCHSRHLRCAVTKAVPLKHYGQAAFCNFGGWGVLKTDLLNDSRCVSISSPRPPSKPVTLTSEENQVWVKSEMVERPLPPQAQPNGSSPAVPPQNG